MKKKIVIIGAAILDVLVQGADKEVFEKGSWPAEDIRMSVGGDGINEATILRKLGLPVRLQTIIGDDIPGKIVREHCRKYGIDLNEGNSDGIPTGLNVVLVQKNGERNFLTNPQSTLRKLTREHIRLPFPKETKIVSFASIFVFSHWKDEELSWLFRQVKEQGAIVCADMTKCKNNETVKDLSQTLPYVDYLLPNYEEASMFTGETDIDRIADVLLEAGVKNVVIKWGRRGCYIKNRETQLTIPAVFGVECVDTTGAGDSFAAGFLYGLYQGYTLEQCGKIANACGALAVQKLGAAEGIDNFAQVEQVLMRMEIPGR